MLLIAKSLGGLSFPKLMEVYMEGNRENGADRYPGETPDRQLALAEEDFREYLSQVFFAAESSPEIAPHKQGNKPMTKKQQADLEDSQPAERRCLFDILPFSSNACSFTRECNADFYN